MTSRAATLPLSFWLFALGFFTCTWDTIFFAEVSGFTFKLYQGAFLLCFLSIVWERRDEGFFTLLSPLSTPFAFCMLIFAGLQMGLAPWSAYPLKSFLYSCWLLFDLCVIWLSVQHLAARLPTDAFIKVAWATLLFLAFVILVDQVAYQFGYTGGLLGGNQDSLLKWGVSRPHAFSFEPSYVASFICLGLITLTVFLFQKSHRKWLFCAGLIAILFACIATTSRTGWLSLTAGFFAIATLPVLIGKKLNWKLLYAFGGTVALVGLLYYFVTPTAQKEAMYRSLIGTIAQGNDGSGNARLRAHILAYQIAEETNWVGTGFGASYRFHLSKGGVDFTTPDPLSQRNSGNELIMSMWGQILAEGGILSLLLFGMSGFFFVRRLFLRWKQDNSSLTLGALSATLVFFGFAAFWLGNVCRGDVWVWFALWSAIADRPKA